MLDSELSNISTRMEELIGDGQIEIVKAEVGDVWK
jgi:hypothetical protein